MFVIYYQQMLADISCSISEAINQSKKPLSVDSSITSL